MVPRGGGHEARREHVATSDQLVSRTVRILHCVGCGAHCDREGDEAQPCWGQVLFNSAASDACGLDVHECAGHEGGIYKEYVELE
jgi:hypothetical protein